jgi:formate C-acetyltransferase
VVYGKFTPATPDGRHSGEPLSDGISAVQGLDKEGPTRVLRSVTSFDHSKYSNGILLNMKFHPTALSNEEGMDKLIQLMSTYFFDMGGMEMQNNIVSAETLKDAQAHPENYTDLVVRIAGFSAYFVEVYKDAQDDLIRRTELMV